MSVSKRLYRVDQNKVFMGVCTGLSEYTDLDVNLVRILFVIITLLGGFTPLVIYIVLGIILPVKELETKNTETIEDEVKEYDEYGYNPDDYKM